MHNSTLKNKKKVLILKKNSTFPEKTLIFWKLYSCSDVFQLMCSLYPTFREIKEISKRTGEALLETGGEAGLGIRGFARFFGKMRLAGKASSSTRKTIIENIEPRVSDFIDISGGCLRDLFSMIRDVVMSAVDNERKMVPETDYSASISEIRRDYENTIAEKRVDNKVLVSVSGYYETLKAVALSTTKKVDNTAIVPSTCGITSVFLVITTRGGGAMCILLFAPSCRNAS